MVSLSKTIFKAYDIRGIIDNTLDAGVARQIGQAFGQAALAKGEKKVVIGRDGRLSGPELTAALAQGLQAAGVDVIDLGVVATPMVYFGTNVLDAASGIMVTGSHNPPDYNGFKMVLAGEAIHGDAITSLYQRIVDHDGSSAATPGSYATYDIRAEYLQRIIGDVKIARPIKIAVDCGNGVAGAFAGDLYRGMGCEVIELFCEVDGTFPNHHPDPAHPENLQDLIRCLQETDAEIGIAFDGDGDRLGVVTKDGQIIYPDRQMMLFSADVLSRHPGEQILYDVKCTRHLAPWISKHGGQPLMYKTGHSLVKAKLRETGAPLGGEMSGHIFFKDRWYGFDDGLYSGARLLEILTREADPSKLLNSLPQSDSTPELHLHLNEGENVALMDKLRSDAVFPGHEQIITIDGLRVEYADGFGLARSSNTTPVIVMRFEAETPEALARIQGQFKSVILAAKPDAELPLKARRMNAQGKRPLNILLVRVSSMGDVLHNLPMVADIARHFPDAHIDWVVEEGYVSLVRLNPRVRTIIPFALRRWRKSLGKPETRAEIKGFFRTLREQEYDYVFDTQGLLKTGIIMGAARIVKGGQKVGLANGSEGSGYEGISRWFHTQSIPTDPRTHAVARGRIVAGAALGYAVDTPADFGLPEVSAGEARPSWMPAEPYTVYFHGTARDPKKWAPANWIELGHALSPMPILLPWGSEKEKAEAEFLAAGIPNARVLPKLSMADANLLARHARLAIGVDTGLTHIAAAFSVPTVEIYADSPRWKTEGNWSPKIINLGDKGTPPSVAEVLAAAKSLLA